VVAAGSTWLAFGPADAVGATVSAQLTLSGVATSSSPAGGATVGVHPGDSVKLTAATIPSAGLPGGLGTLLGGLVGGLAEFEVVLTSGNLPGVNYPYKLGQAPGDHQRLTLSALKPGTYHFTYEAHSVSLLGVVPLDLTGAQLDAISAAGIPLKFNAQNRYVGSIVAADAPPAGGLSVQLPSTGVSVSAGPIQVNPNLPGLVAPTLSVPSSLPAAGGATGASAPAADVPEQVELAASRPWAPSGVPVLLAIIAVVALGTVIALYAKSYLLRRPH